MVLASLKRGIEPPVRGLNSMDGMPMMMMTNPNEIAELLIEEEGLERAIEIAFDGVARANEERAYFALSVWREVKHNLLTRFDAAKRAAEREKQGNRVAS